MAQEQKEDPILAKAQAIAALPKEQQKTAILAAEQAADREHAAKHAEPELDEEAAHAKAEEEKAAAEKAHIEAVKVIGDSKAALIKRISEQHGSFKHDLSTDKENGDMIIHSYVLFGEGPRARRVATARRIPRDAIEEMDRDELAAIEVEQLHVLATRLGV